MKTCLEVSTIEEDSFNKLIKRYSNAVYGVAYSILKDFHLAQDIAQEVFIKAFSKLDTLQDPNSVGSWLYSTTRRTCLDWLKTAQRHNAPPESVSSPSDNVEERTELGNGLAALPPDSRLALILFYICGYTVKEIADFLHVGHHSVESRLGRARKALRMELIEMIEENLRENRLDTDFETRVMELLKLHISFSSTGKQRDALQVIREALALKPDDIDLRSRLADTLLQTECGTGDTSYFEEAEREYKSLIEYDPGNYSGLGYAYMFMRKYDQAIDAFNRLPIQASTRRLH